MVDMFPQTTKLRKLGKILIDMFPYTVKWGKMAVDMFPEYDRAEFDILAIHSSHVETVVLMSRI